MERMDNEHGMTVGNAPRWDDRPTAQQRNGLQHAVTALLDGLAPERPPARGPDVVAAVQRFRTPRGCILQAAARAVSVSWFPPGAADLDLGELHVVTWSGRVARPGAARRPEEGETARTLVHAVLTPAMSPTGDWEWQAPNGARHARAAVIARCEAELVGPEVAGAPPASVEFAGG